MASIHMRDWADDERPRERLLCSGAAQLSDAELLAVLLGCGTAGLSAVDLARVLLNRFGGIRSTLNAGYREITAVRGIGRGKAAVEFIGMPEARIPLAHATVYLATAPKSNRAYAAIDRALRDVAEGRTLAVPEHLRTKTRKKLAVEGGGASEADTHYQYSHDYDGAYVPQAYLPEGRRYYEPGEQGLEKRVAERLEYWRQRFAEENPDASSS